MTDKTSIEGATPLSGMAAIGFFFLTVAIVLLAPHLSETDAKALAVICGSVGAIAMLMAVILG